MKFINNYCNFIICAFLFFFSCASEKKIAGYTTIDQKSSSQGKIYYGPHFDTPPQALNLDKIKKNIPYPEKARKLGIEGIVYFKIFIDEKGEVREVVIVKPLHPMLDTVAVKMVKKLKFIPAKKYGKFPVSVWISFPFRFNLEE